MTKIGINEEDVELLRKEYNEKCDFLLGNGWSEGYFRDYVNAIFFREYFDNPFAIPFEERQSKEYQIWKQEKIKQRAEFRRLKHAEAVEAEKEGRKPRSVPKLSIDYSRYEKWRYNPLVIWRTSKGFKHHILLNEEDSLDFVEDRQFAIMSPLTYVGRTRRSKNARFCYGFAIDLDGVTTDHLANLLHQMRTKDPIFPKTFLPRANFIVVSGTGIHVYYLFENPVPLFERHKMVLNALKHFLTSKLWQYKITTSVENIQYQPIFQGFRVPGSLTKFGTEVRAFFDVEAPYFKPSDFIYYKNFPDVKKNMPLMTDQSIKFEDMDLVDGSKNNPMGHSLAYAKEKWPEWYRRRVENKEERRVWHSKRWLYDWWYRMLNTEDKVSVGHRYNCILCLAVYAAKCAISFEELKRDAYNLLERFEALTVDKNNHFTKEDVEAALKGYKEELCTMTFKTISRLSGIKMENDGKKKFSRKGRSKELHLQLARMTEAIVRPNWRWKGGKSPCQTTEKKEHVKAWRAANPTGTKVSCARELGIDYKTVLRNWGQQNSPQKRVQEWRKENPAGTKAACSRAIGISRPTVGKYWD